MVTLHKDLFFEKCALDLVCLYQKVLPNSFYSVQILLVFKLREEDLPEGSPSKDHQHLEVFELRLYNKALASFGGFGKECRL